MYCTVGLGAVGLGCYGRFIATSTHLSCYAVDVVSWTSHATLQTSLCCGGLGWGRATVLTLDFHTSKSWQWRWENTWQMLVPENYIELPQCSTGLCGLDESKSAERTMNAHKRTKTPGTQTNRPINHETHFERSSNIAKCTKYDRTQRQSDCKFQKNMPENPCDLHRICPM